MMKRLFGLSLGGLALLVSGCVGVFDEITAEKTLNLGEISLSSVDQKFGTETTNAVIRRSESSKGMNEYLLTLNARLNGTGDAWLRAWLLTRVKRPNDVVEVHVCNTFFKWENFGKQEQEFNVDYMLCEFVNATEQTSSDGDHAGDGQSTVVRSPELLSEADTAVFAFSIADYAPEGKAMEESCELLDAKDDAVGVYDLLENVVSSYGSTESKKYMHLPAIRLEGSCPQKH